MNRIFLTMFYYFAVGVGRLAHGLLIRHVIPIDLKLVSGGGDIWLVLLRLLLLPQQERCFITKLLRAGSICESLFKVVICCLLCKNPLKSLHEPTVNSLHLKLIRRSMLKFITRVQVLQVGQALFLLSLNLLFVVEVVIVLRVIPLHHLLSE